MISIALQQIMRSGWINSRCRENMVPKQDRVVELNSLFFCRLKLGVDFRILVTMLVTAWAVPVTQHTNADSEKHVRYDDRQNQMLQIVFPRVTRNDNLIECLRIIAWKWRDTNVLISTITRVKL